MTEQERQHRSEVARMLASFKRRNRGGRPRNPDRCPCGKFTRTRAADRRHKCEAREA